MKDLSAMFIWLVPFVLRESNRLTTLKTVSMYLRAAKTDAEDAGEATDGMANSVSELRNQILALTGNKVDIQIDEDTFKSPYQILKELSEVWSEISDISRANILEMVGGKRNANVVAALLENFEVAEKSLAVSADSAGSALAENEKMLDSIDGKIAKLSATFETLSQDVLESEHLKVGIDIVNFLLKILDLLAKANVLLPSIAASVLLIRGYINADKIMNNISGLIPRILSEKVATDGLKQSVEALNLKEKELLRTKIEAIAVSQGWSKELIESTLKNYGLSASLDAVGRSGNIASVGIKALYTSMSMLSKIGLWASVITAVMGVIASLVDWIKKTEEESIAAKKAAVEDAKESAKAYKDMAESVEEYKESIESLRKEIDLGNISESEAYEKRKELLSIQDSLIDKFGEEARGINLVTGEIEEQIKKLDELSARKYNSWVNENLPAINAAKNYLTKDSYEQGYVGNIIQYLNNIEGLTDIDGVEFYGETIGSFLGFRNANHKPTGMRIVGTPDERIETYNELINLLKESGYYDSEEYPDFVKFVETLSSSLKTLIEERDSQYELYSPYLEGALALDERFSESYNYLNDAFEIFKRAVSNDDPEKIRSAIDGVMSASQKLLDDTSDTDIEDYASDYVYDIISKISSERLKEGLRNGIGIGKDGGKYLQKLLEDFSGGTISKQLLTDAANDFESIKGLLSSEQISAYEELTYTLSLYRADLSDLIDALQTLHMYGFVPPARETLGLPLMSDADKERLDKIGEYMNMYESAKRGESLSNLEIADILAENPDLASSIIRVADGYNIETTAIESLIKAEAAQIKMSAELRKENARLNLVATRDGSSGSADWIDSVFSQNSDNISSVDDFKKLVGQQMIPTAEIEYISATIAANKVAMIDEGIKNLSKYLFGNDNSGDAKQKTAFEKAYEDHQHYLAMEQETQEEYLNWLTNAYEAAYKSGEIELDDYRKYQEEVYEGLKELFDDHLNDEEHRISLLQLEEGAQQEVISSYSSLIDDVEKQIADYRARGLDENSDYIQELTDKLNEYKENIIETIEDIVDKANEAVDGIKGAYDSLTNAAKEYAENGYLSVDSLQAILEISPKYLAMLHDENGQLVINEKSIQAVMAARAEELGAETALAYAKQILIATENSEIEKLATLTNITVNAGNATWDMAYATLALARATGEANGVDSKYYDNALKSIANMQKLTKTSVNSISAFYKTLDRNYVSHKDALDKIIDLTKELIEWEHEKQIEALEEEKDNYSEIIEQKKEMLELAKEQEDREKSVAEKIAEMAKLQAQISQLSLDDSREAQAQRRKLEEELAELQKDVADEQADYSHDKQIEALDKELEAFEKNKDEEIKSAEDAYEEMYGSAEKLHQAAIDRMSSDWDSLYDQLLNWNYNYGSTLQEELVSAWDAASEAVKRYGSVVDAIGGVDGHTNIGSDGSSLGANVLESMRKNALDWWTATGSEQKIISKNQVALGEQYRALTGEGIYRNNGSWFHEDGSSLFELSKDEIAHAIVDKMKQNSAMWMIADSGLQSSLANQNNELANRLKSVLGANIHRDSSGVWWIGNQKLYDVYHSGGIVGNKPSLKEKEVMAILEEGEAVLDEEKKNGLLRAVDFISALSERLGTALDAENINRIFGGIATVSARTAIADGLNKSVNKIAAGANGGYHVDKIEVTAPINVVERLDDEEIKRHAKTIGTIAASHIKDGFTKQGISKTAKIF